jgi:hypothetical protein
MSVRASSEYWTNWPLSWKVHFDLHGEKVRSEEVVIASGKEDIVLMSTSSGSANLERSVKDPQLL